MVITRNKLATIDARCTDERLAAAQTAELERIDADRQYHEATLAAPVVVYGNGKAFGAVVPSIRRNNKDKSGNWVLQPPKTAHNLKRWRSIAGL